MKRNIQLLSAMKKTSPPDASLYDFGQGKTRSKWLRFFRSASEYNKRALLNATPSIINARKKNSTSNARKPTAADR